MIGFATSGMIAVHFGQPRSVKGVYGFGNLGVSADVLKFFLSASKLAKFGMFGVEAAYFQGAADSRVYLVGITLGANFDASGGLLTID